MPQTIYFLGKKVDEKIISAKNPFNGLKWKESKGEYAEKLPDLEIKLIDGRVGFGVCARTKIKKGELIAIYEGQKQKASFETISRYSVPATPDDVPTPSHMGGREIYLIDAEKEGGVARFINHAPDAKALQKNYTFKKEFDIDKVGRQNVKVRHKKIEGELRPVIVAEEDIDVGNFLFFDYGGKYFAFLNVRPELFFKESVGIVPHSVYQAKELSIASHPSCSLSEITITEISRQRLLMLAQNNPVVYFGQGPDYVAVESFLVGKALNKDLGRSSFYFLGKKVILNKLSSPVSIAPASAMFNQGVESAQDVLPNCSQRDSMTNLL